MSLGRVLLVDDDDDWRMLLCMCFEDGGFDVTVGRNVREGKRLLGDEHFEVLITDVVLPDGTGYDLLQGGRPASLRYAAVLTGRSGETEQAASVAAGFDAHFTKPVDAANLVQQTAERLRSLGA